MSQILTKTQYLIAGGIVGLLSTGVVALLLPTLSYYDFPSCNPTPEEQRRQILEEVPYVHGNVRQVSEQTITIEADFRYLNRWKCEEMRSPYQEVIGSLTKSYTLTITPQTQIVPIGDPRYRFVPNDHRPEFLPEPNRILEELDTQPQSQVALQDILRDSRIIAVTQGEPALTNDSFAASLIMVDPHRSGLYNFGVQMTVFLSTGLLIATIITILAQIPYQLTAQSWWIIVSLGVKSTAAIAFIIWYLIQLT